MLIMINNSEQINVSGSIILVDTNKLLVLMDSSESEIFDSAGIEIHTRESLYETVDHQISNSETISTLRENQWLVEFTLKTK